MKVPIPLSRAASADQNYRIKCQWNKMSIVIVTYEGAHPPLQSCLC